MSEARRPEGPTGRLGAAESSPEGERGECICTPWGGCDAEGDPRCKFCRDLDCELPCPADPESWADNQGD